MAMAGTPMEVIQAYLGPQFDAILRWAVGEDYQQRRFAEYPALMAARTGLPIAEEEEMEVTLEKVRHAWDSARPGPAGATPSPWASADAAAGLPMDRRMTSIPGPRGIQPRAPRPTPPPPTQHPGTGVTGAPVPSSLDGLVDLLADAIWERLVARMTERVAGGKGL